MELLEAVSAAKATGDRMNPMLLLLVLFSFFLSFRSATAEVVWI